MTLKPLLQGERVRLMAHADENLTQSRRDAKTPSFFGIISISGGQTSEVFKRRRNLA